MQLIDLAFPYQKEFITNHSKRKIWISSRQIGKSWTIAFILVRKALEKKNGLTLCISVNSRSASEIIKKCSQFAEAVKTLSKGTITYQSAFDHITFSNGSRILSLPSTSDGLRGWTASCVCVDEAAFVYKLDEIMQGISPTLTRDPNSELILTTTPAGMNGPFYEMYSRALEDEQWYVQTTTIHDAIQNGLVVDLDSLHRLCPDKDIFAQEYECKFMSSYGSLIDLDIIDWYDEMPKGNPENYLGMDIGSTSDRSAIVTAKRILDTTYIDDIVMLSKTSYEEQLKIVKEMHAINRYSSGYIDKTGIGSAFAEFCTKQISSRLKGLQFTVANKTPMFEQLRSQIFEHKIKFNKKLKKLIEDDFRNVQRIVTESGQIRYVAGHDQNGHSDATSAIVLALQAIHDMPSNAKTPFTYMHTSRF